MAPGTKKPPVERQRYRGFEFGQAREVCRSGNHEEDYRRWVPRTDYGMAPDGGGFVNLHSLAIFIVSHLRLAFFSHFGQMCSQMRLFASTG